jgi:DNA-binding transcriptional LysR family regulator
VRRDHVPDLTAFVAVAEERSFTRAAARLGMSQSALSTAISALEARIGIRLLARTTRSVATTEAGQRLLETARPALDSIAAEIEALASLKHRLSGNLRITSIEHAATSLLLPALTPFLAEYPGISVEVDVNDAFVDIVAQRFDAGVRFGEHVEKDMIALPIGEEVRAAIVATPAYFAEIAPPQSPRDLDRHRCIGYRLAGSGQIYRWQFSENGRPLEVTVSGSLLVNKADMLVQAALAGQGLCYAFEHLVGDHLRSGRLVRVLEAWCPPMPGYYLYYPSRQKTPALAALIQALQSSRHAARITA